MHVQIIQCVSRPIHKWCMGDVYVCIFRRTEHLHYAHWDSNLGPSVSQADVITSTPWAYAQYPHFGITAMKYQTLTLAKSLLNMNIMYSISMYMIYDTLCYPKSSGQLQGRRCILQCFLFLLMFGKKRKKKHHFDDKLETPKSYTSIGRPVSQYWTLRVWSSNDFTNRLMLTFLRRQWCRTVTLSIL